MLKMKKLRENAKVPQYATSGSAGLDLSACIDEPLTLKPQERALVPTGLAVEIETGKVGLVFARSGISIKKGIALSNGVGVIDSDYRGEICCGLINLSNEAYVIQPSDRIAQMVITPYFCEEIMEVSELDETKRADGGFGSSGR